MQGLRNSPANTEPFVRFFEIVQRAASEDDKVFFIESGYGDVEDVGELECETLTGWLVDSDDVDEFEPKWASGAAYGVFDDDFIVARWKQSDNGVEVKFSEVFA